MGLDNARRAPPQERFDLERLVVLRDSEHLVIWVIDLEYRVEDADECAFVQVPHVPDLDLEPAVALDLRVPQWVSLAHRQELLGVDVVWCVALAGHGGRLDEERTRKGLCCSCRNVEKIKGGRTAPIRVPTCTYWLPEARHAGEAVPTWRTLYDCIWSQSTEVAILNGRYRLTTPHVVEPAVFNQSQIA